MSFRGRDLDRRFLLHCRRGTRRARGRAAPDRAKQPGDPGPNFPGPALVDQLDSSVGLSQVALERVGPPPLHLELIGQFAVGIIELLETPDLTRPEESGLSLVGLYERLDLLTVPGLLLCQDLCLRAGHFDLRTPILLLAPDAAHAVSDSSSVRSRNPLRSATPSLVASSTSRS